MEKNKITIVAVLLAIFWIGMFQSTVQAQNWNCINLGLASFAGVGDYTGLAFNWLGWGNYVLLDNDDQRGDECAFTSMNYDEYDPYWLCDGGQNVVLNDEIAYAMFNALYNDSLDVCLVFYLSVSGEEYGGYTYMDSILMTVVRGSLAPWLLVHEVGHLAGLPDYPGVTEKIMDPDFVDPPTINDHYCLYDNDNEPLSYYYCPSPF